LLPSRPAIVTLCDATSVLLETMPVSAFGDVP
jgi:hypothetical protein